MRNADVTLPRRLALPASVRKRLSKATLASASQFELLAEVAMRELDDEALGWFSRRLP